MVAKRMVKQLLVMGTVVVFAAAPALADNINDVLNDAKLSYPELEVTPRASARLKMEARAEIYNHWELHIPVQSSALLTLAAAISAQPRANLSSSQQSAFDSSKQIAIGVGVGWLAITLGLSAWYRPYLSGYREIARMPNKTERQQLTRERLAEEALYAPEDLAIKIKWFSFVSNLAANVAVMTNADKSSQGFLAVAAFASLAPILFPYRWETVAELQRKYLKRIYGPVTSAVLMPVEVANSSRAPDSVVRYSPGVEMQWTF